ncbi:DUF4241 domain-containing protein [Kitasatospora sp. NPDC088264]|uniref:DUF4241 domain-containing protein n=1 Tax=Kitasatospora sp. NPDC088264 TaxID=3155296 RepID=UPI003433EAD3
MPLAAPDVVRLFTAGSSYDRSQGMTATLAVRPEATLSLPSGKVAACDPFIGLSDVDPFTAEVDPGTYSIVLSVVEITRAEFPEAVDEPVAASWLQVSDKPTVEWTLALSKGQATNANARSWSQFRSHSLPSSPVQTPLGSALRPRSGRV